MFLRSPTVESRLLVRQCVECGYDGALLRRGRAARCARCGCDLRRRPARSYAEMEGFVGTPAPAPGSAPAQQRLVQRWLAFIFLLALALSAVIYLAARAVSG